MRIAEKSVGGGHRNLMVTEKEEGLAPTGRPSSYLQHKVVVPARGFAELQRQDGGSV